MKYISRLLLLLLLIASANACSDYLTPSTQQNKTRDQGIKTIADLYSLMDGVYNHMTSTAYYGRNFIVTGEGRTDNAFSDTHSGRFENVNKLNYTVSDDDVTDLWEAAYETIANCNLIINSNVESSPKVKYVKGEAYAIRAKVHMDLLTRFGQAYVEGSNDMGVPYITEYGDGKFYPGRGSVQETWDKIGADFHKAVSLMSPQFDGSPTTLTYYGARALQARYFLTVGKYDSASVAAKDIIDNGNYQIISASNYVDSWKTKENANSIFELAFSASDNHGSDALAYIYLDTNYGDIEVTKGLYDLYDPNDVRLGLYDSYIDKNNFHVYRMVGKYSHPTGTDNIHVIRYAEVVLTYAEAQAEMGDPGEAKKYLDLITSNRNAPAYSAATVENIRLERRKELAMEGLRFLDLMRTHQDINRVVPGRHQYDIKVPFGDYRLAYPIPQSELDANENLKQNKGYN